MKFRLVRHVATFVGTWDAYRIFMGKPMETSTWEYEKKMKERGFCDRADDTRIWKVSGSNVYTGNLTYACIRF
jgi:hypothetical protein